MASSDGFQLLVATDRERSYFWVSLGKWMETACADWLNVVMLDGRMKMIETACADWLNGVMLIGRMIVC